MQMDAKHSTRSIQPAKGARAELIQKAAALLSAPPPDELVIAIEIIVDAVVKAEHETANSPARADVRDLLEDLGTAAQFIANGLADPRLEHVRRALQTYGSNNQNRITSERMQDFVEGIRWVQEAVPGGQGRDNLLDKLGMARGKLICATAAKFLFKETINHSPSKRNAKAGELCHLIWRAAGGTYSDAVEDGEDYLACWELHLKNACGPGEEPTNDAGWHAASVVAQAIIDSGLRDVIAPKTDE